MHSKATRLAQHSRPCQATLSAPIALFETNKISSKNRVLTPDLAHSRLPPLRSHRNWQTQPYLTIRYERA